MSFSTAVLHNCMKPNSTRAIRRHPKSTTARIGTRWHGTSAKAKKSADSRTRPCDSNTPLNPGEIMLSSPLPVSQCRLTKFYQPPDETPAQQAYRELREQAVEFHRDFWHQENGRFEANRAVYKGTQQHTDTATHTSAMGEGAPATASEAVDMGPFYQDYLEQAYQRHLKYNRIWWGMNLQMVGLGIRASLSRWFRNSCF
ncbi:hypothetical protein H4R33_004568 [Dimargaris cristalligena]|uniref:Uncharacterized protein n=1 Tax=Dimargaris cristalligena TaxID=215637 RepID=A0A4P9ZSG9_9FUNG|nr:hypothetical protein H4R33_004568 [Dimargaris cristalligena]RKP35751.1 hypothetical protein BJ085DRAFT_40401 [Dimargaris cristalligena]|eukprot:RKP35751.1 hypothetical protein BJ085DRAFT_40401 [Dimargaris cristalligena]